MQIHKKVVAKNSSTTRTSSASIKDDDSVIFEAKSVEGKIYGNINYFMKPVVHHFGNVIDCIPVSGSEQ